MPEYLIAKTTRPVKFGRYERELPAGTEVEVRPEAIERGDHFAYVRVAGRPRLSAVVAVASLIPA